jgi:hypothetical protein
MALPVVRKLWFAYPVDVQGGIPDLVGGDMGALLKQTNANTCCVRLSRSLNYSGAPIDGFGGIVLPGQQGAKVRALRGSDMKWYIYGIHDLKAYLSTRVGPAKWYTGDESALRKAVQGTPGIIMFGFEHVSIWSGSEVRYYPMFGDSKVKNIGIYFWPTTGSIDDDPNETVDGWIP